jgi:hypothetical protein
LQWYDTLSVPVTPLVPDFAAVTTGDADDAVPAAVLEPLKLDHLAEPGVHVVDPLPSASGAEHENSIRK